MSTASQPASAQTSPDLAAFKAKVDLIRRRDFAGKLPDSLERVAGIYLEMAAEYLACGESIAGILQCIDMAAVNALAMAKVPS